MTNRLAHELSPYLLQHKDNPVDWYPWGEEAFQKSRAENKPIFLSIGYSTCYWCHVMEHDSFEKEEIAAILNREFVPIKVDREQRPDVDQIYMDAVIGINGQGGWPMSVFLTSELKPFWGGTFFYRDQFAQILLAIAEAWKKDPLRIVQSAEQITEALRDRPTSSGISVSSPDSLLPLTTQSDMVEYFESRWDREFGGFNAAPKFPPSGAINFLLRQAVNQKNVTALAMVESTLEGMARGGIYDHLAGGFARYSTDAEWRVPHFEKMLYDNALLAISYLDAYIVTQKTVYAEVARSIFSFLEREMLDAAGGFYAALDAGEVDKEGEFYVWKDAELRSLLESNEYEMLKQYYEITPEGNFEHGQIVICIQKDVDLELGLGSELVPIKQKLFNAREKRERPLRDDKIITAWNGLVINAFSRAAFVLGDHHYSQVAEKAAQYIEENLYRNGLLLRCSFNGQVSGAGFLDDYSYLIEGVITLYEVTGNKRWWQFALSLQKQQDATFWDVESQSYLYSAAKELVVRKRETYEGATPSPTSTALMNLVRMFYLDGDLQYRERALKLINTLTPIIAQQPIAVIKAVQAVLMLEADTLQLAIVEGKDGKLGQLLEPYRKSLIPMVMAIKHDDSGLQPGLLKDKQAVAGNTTVYLCNRQGCHRV